MMQLEEVMQVDVVMADASKCRITHHETVQISSHCNEVQFIYLARTTTSSCRTINHG